MNATVFSSPCSRNCNKKSREELIAAAMFELQHDLDGDETLALRRRLKAAPIADVESFCRDVLGISTERAGEWSLADAFFTTGIASNCPRADEIVCDGCDRDGSAAPKRDHVADLKDATKEIARLKGIHKEVARRMKATRAKARAARKELFREKYGRRLGIFALSSFFSLPLFFSFSLVVLGLYDRALLLNPDFSFWPIIISSFVFSVFCAARPDEYAKTFPGEF